MHVGLMVEGVGSTRRSVPEPYILRGYELLRELLRGCEHLRELLRESKNTGTEYQRRIEDRLILGNNRSFTCEIYAHTFR